MVKPDGQEFSEHSRRIWLWLPDAAWAAFVFAGLLLLCVLLVQRFRRDQVFTDLAEQHVAAIEDSAALFPAGADPLSTCAEGKPPFPASSTGLWDILRQYAKSASGAQPFTVLGCRVVSIGQQPGAQLVFRYRQQRVSAFIFQNQGRLARVSPQDGAARRASFNVDTWAEGGLRYVLIGNAGRKDLRALREWLRGSVPR